MNIGGYIAATFVLVCTATAQAQTQVPNDFQSGQPARASEVNENFDTLEAAIDKNASDLQSISAGPQSKRDLLDQNELSSVWSNSLNAHFDLVKIGNDLYSCGQSYLFGCDRAISADGTEFINLEYFPRTASVHFWDPIANTRIDAIPTDIVAGFGQLRFVGIANLTAHRGRGQMLVDDCDNPTVGYVQQNRNPRDPNTPQTVVNNSGQLYELDNFNSVDVDVTGNTYGVMNFIVHGDNTTPTCTPGVSDRTGVWQQYTYTFVVDLNEARFAGPYTYQGSSIGLLDRVEALENP